MRRKSAYSHIAKVNQSAQRFTSNMATMINCRSTRGLRNRERFRKELRTSFRGCFSPNSQFAFLKFFQCIHNHDTGDASTTTRLGEREERERERGEEKRREEKRREGPFCLYPLPVAVATYRQHSDGIKFLFLLHTAFSLPFQFAMCNAEATERGNGFVCERHSVWQPSP